MKQRVKGYNWVKIEFLANNFVYKNIFSKLFTWLSVPKYIQCFAIECIKAMRLHFYLVLKFDCCSNSVFHSLVKMSDEYECMNLPLFNHLEHIEFFRMNDNFVNIEKIETWL